MTVAATTAGAFKAYIETLGLGLAVYRDGPPMTDTDTIGAAYPYVVVQEGIGASFEQHGDFGDPDADDAERELVQIDLYQLARETTSTGSTRVVEQYRLPDTLTHALRGTGVQPYSPHTVFGHRPTQRQRWPIADNVVRHTWTVEVHRSSRERVTA